MDVQTISIALAGIGIFIAAINSIISSRQANQQRAIELKNQELSLQAQQQALETRQAELFINIYNQWTARDTLKAYGRIRYEYEWTDLKDWWRKYAPGIHPDAHADRMTLNTYFEGLGVLVKKGLIDLSFVEDLLSQRIIWYWETRMQPEINEIREGTGDLTQYDSMEYLYNVMKQRQQAAVTA